ncbi:MAG: ABC transporter ATP-binding protein [Clostridia bacterium]|nr:ABC transporter ATP-binding protein [Clostridia bacterium]
MMKNPSASTIAKVLSYMKSYRWFIALSLLLALISVVLTLYVPILIGRAIDDIVEAGQVNFSRIVPLLAESCVLVAVTAVMQWIMNTVNNRITYSVVRDVRSAAFSHIQKLPLSYLDRHPSGSIVSRVIADADQFADGLLMGFTQLFTGAATIVGTLIFMLTIHPLIAVVVVVLTPVSLLVAKFIASRTYSMFHKQSEVRGTQTALIDEILGNLKLVQAFSYEETALSRFDAINGELEKCSLTAIFFSSLVNPTTRFVNSLVYAAVALSGALTAVFGTLSIGSLSCFLSYANQYTKPFNEISGVITELQNALACASRLFDLIEAPAQIPDAPDAGSLEQATGRVDLHDVTFSYTPEQSLIHNLNLHVRPGQRIAIVGPTGCGKTTLINLLMRFYDVNSGEISVDGFPVTSLTRADLRKNFGMVLQDTWLKSGTVRENIKFGLPDASDEDMIRAAKAAHAHSFIRRLPHGYDTVIGEDGGNLSHGQKQLLCISRVMLCLPPILILDEATSSIDTRTEIRIQKAFQAMMEGRTSFIVAHRLSTIREADMILVMNHGNVIEQGTHEELLAKNGFYTHLYNSQFGE